MAAQAILMHESDDVATALTDLKAGDVVTVTLGQRTATVTLLEDVPFPHKLSLHDIACGQEVLKYGLSIGKATQDIPAGAWVSIHNCRSDRLGFHWEQYGPRA
jgi:altronate dehydratase small subunit